MTKTRMTRPIPPTAELRLVVAFCTPWPGAYRRPLHLGVLGVVTRERILTALRQHPLCPRDPRARAEVALDNELFAFTGDDLKAVA